MMSFKRKKKVARYLAIVFLVLSVCIPILALDVQGSDETVDETVLVEEEVTSAEEVIVDTEDEEVSIEEEIEPTESEEASHGTIHVVYTLVGSPWTTLDTETLSGEVGTPYSIEIKEFDGFTHALTGTESLPLEGVFQSGETTVYLSYYYSIFTMKLVDVKIRDNHNESLERPEFIEFELSRTTSIHNEPEYYTTVRVNVDSNNDVINHTFDGEHERFSPEGKQYRYFIKMLPSNYAMAFSHSYLWIDSSNNTMAVSGTLVPDANKTEIIIYKNFGFDSGEAFSRKSDPKIPIKIHVYADGIEIEGSPFDFNEDNQWVVSIADLPTRDETGEKIEYTIEEETVRGYYPEIIESETVDVFSGTRFLYFHVRNRPAKDVSVTKIWEGGPDLKPNITLQLYRDEYVYDYNASKPEILTTKQGEPVVLSHGETSYTWENLPVGKGDGSEEKLYTYWVEEVEVPEGYEVSYSDDTFTITNTFNPDLVRKEIRVNKIWDDHDDEKALRPQTIKVNLYADGEFVEMVVLEESTQWTYLFEDLVV